MKQTSIVLFLLLLIDISYSQDVNCGEGYNYKFKTSRHANGKLSKSFVASGAASTRILLKDSETDQGNENPLTLNMSAKNPSTFYHVVFHFDVAPFWVLCNGVDTVFDSFYYNMNWINDVTLEAYMPPGYYDILSCFFEPSLQSKYVFAENFHITGNTDTTILSTSANHKITLNGVDENYVALPNNSKQGDQVGLNIEFPNNFQMQRTRFSFRAWPNDYMKFSDVSPNLKIYFGKSAMLKSDQYKRYEIAYPAQVGINSDKTLENFPSDYRYYSLIFNSSPLVSSSYFIFTYGILNNCLLGPMDYFGSSIGAHDTPSKAIDTVQLFSSNVAVDTNKYLFFYGLGHCEADPAGITGTDQIIDQWFYYITPDDKLVLCQSGKYPPVKGDYLVSENFTNCTGKSAPYNMAYANNSYVSSYEIRVVSWSKGQANEKRGVDDLFGTYDIWKQNQRLYHDSIRSTGIVYYAGAPGPYSVILNDSNYILCGRPGYLQSNLSFDLSNNDADPPVLKTMQILQGDSIETNLIHGYPATVLFTAGDWVRIPNRYSKVYRPLREAHLYFKQFEAPVWQELTIQALSANLDTILGLPYIADLAQILNQYPDSAYIDLMIELTDSAGNSNIQTIHPAFLVRDAMTGIKPIINELYASIYPDPATDKINIVTIEKNFVVTIFGTTGQPIIEVVNKKEIDVSGLDSGLYIARIKSTSGDMVTYTKFIRK